MSCNQATKTKLHTIDRVAAALMLIFITSLFILTELYPQHQTYSVIPFILSLTTFTAAHLYYHNQYEQMECPP